MMPPKTAEIIVPLRFMLTVGTLIATLLVYFHRVRAPFCSSGQQRASRGPAPG